MSIHRGSGLLQHRPLNFTDDFVAADFFENGSGLHIESGIVVNLSSTRLALDDAIKTSIAPWRSAMLSKAMIEQSGRIENLQDSRPEWCHVPRLGLARQPHPVFPAPDSALHLTAAHGRRSRARPAVLFR
ncbi:hypothetical protein [Mesorhizobium sp. M0207]|uniref:hypothetical protein n=1 Tax=unclassified Mesorhizobium TaxID=325217 RepID=UPI0033377BE1